jgi:hypothetical protein
MYGMKEEDWEISFFIQLIGHSQYFFLLFVLDISIWSCMFLHQTQEYLECLVFLEMRVHKFLLFYL